MLFFNNEDQVLYPATWEYNAILIISELNKIIENHGGKVKPAASYNKGYIQPRNIEGIDPVKVENSNYTNFIYEDNHYYVELDDNPFFDFHFWKTPVIDNKYSKDAVGENLDKSWLWDSFLYSDERRAAADDRKEAANIIFNFLVSAPECKKSINTHRVRVSNTFNSGYHYETVKDKERFEKIDY